ncbi:Aste57867_730 [Aphanomyces stellatus]|uniref:Aste57867_730 protein n=1 Tax=Aphanomyces stellatus TaxID=120398 RepID=A0A485K8M8_9STRA|nr:hypothetical protein As57867_000729 [Aphanomyces stellatus]VFT77954.1 Aste57867_730 [Aphanomyces stellatus]
MTRMPQRPLGSQGLVCSAQGLGCMGMTSFTDHFDRAAQEKDSLSAIEAALHAGVNFFDTAWVYQSFGDGGGGNFTNEALLGKAMQRFGREKFILATKFGIVPPSPNCLDGSIAVATQCTVSNAESVLRSQLAESLARLETNYIDLYYVHRVDPWIPIEDTMALLKTLVEDGTIKYVGICACTADELRRAHAVHPITALQIEWSLRERAVECCSILQVARDLGIGIVAYCPLGNGFLTAADAFDKLDEKDVRRQYAPFRGDRLDESKAKAVGFFVHAQEYAQATPAQLALAWLHAQGPDVFPIPGSKSAARVKENAHAVHLHLSCDDVNALARSTGPRK